MHPQRLAWQDNLPLEQGERQIDKSLGSGTLACPLGRSQPTMPSAVVPSKSYVDGQREKLPRCRDCLSRAPWTLHHVPQDTSNFLSWLSGVSQECAHSG